MAQVFVLLVVLCIMGIAVFRPWVGISGYYLYTIWGPQYIWWWHFHDLRVANMLAIGSILGVGINVLRKKKYNFNFLLNKQSIFMALLWVSLVFSYYFGAYSGKFIYFNSHGAWIFSLTNNIFLMYFVSVLEINQMRKLGWFIVIFVFSATHLYLWANNQYLSQNWSQFHMGRLMGPSSLNGAIYRDENVFAMFMVSGLPFIFYWGLGLKKKLFRWSIWAALPLGCHAIFLTGSRGGLLGIGTVLLVTTILSKRKIFSIPIILIFLIFFQFQAGGTMKNRSEKITNIEGEQSANDRLVAWQGGGRMLLNHPIRGVGLGMFQVALPFYIESRNMVAHNTVIQFSAESGVFAGLSYLALIFIFFRRSKRIFLWAGRFEQDEKVKKINYYNKAIIASFSGVTVCSIFLSLNTYEVFFLLILLNNSIFKICSKEFLRHQSHNRIASGEAERGVQ